jgi:CheY-like chemotaxis protein
VLVVEDEALVRQLTAEMLTALGHPVRAAGKAKPALALLENNPIDVLLTDVRLPDMSGVELAIAARRLNPDVRIVFATGDKEAVGLDQRDGLAGAVVIAKPYREEELAEALAGLK